MRAVLLRKSRSVRGKWYVPSGKAVVIAWLLVLAALGWYRWHESPRILVRNIAKAEYAVVSSRSSAALIFVAGEELRSLVRVLSAATRDRESYPATFSSRIEFYRGTNLLSTIHFQHDLFWTGKEQYREHSELLDDLTLKIIKGDEPQIAWVEGLVEDLRGKPELAQLQPWSVRVLEGFGKGRIKTATEGVPRLIRLEDSEIPNWLTSAWRYPPAVCLRRGPAGKIECVVVHWRQAYGFLVGPSNCATTFAPHYLTNTAPGIYVFYNEGLSITE